MIRVSSVLIVGLISWWSLWLTPDQQGQRFMDQQQFQSAAESFRDPMRQGAAWFRAGEFEKAEQAFARVASAEAEYNRGNCLIMRGKYEPAIKRYDRALKLRPNWKDAQANRAIAEARAKLVKRTGGDMGDQKLGADDVVFDKNKKRAGGTETVTDDRQQLSDQAMQALWLRRVQTKPADFLRHKFAFQAADQEAEGSEP